MSVNISIKNAVKKYGENTIIPDLSIDIRDKEFFTLLGPSGCGKTTLLRMIAGFNTIEGGDFFFDEKRINDMEVSKRNIGMVFQNYAIFPHYTVQQNVEFGLKNRKLPKNEIQRAAAEFLDLMQILEFKDRMPERLSGGQQQRVALARALVIKPDVLLMDEPLSNLDAKLRMEMRQAIRNLQKEVGITTIYVTHDQEEAMAISDRIAVMKDGIIQHVGTPREIYHRPRNIFVATFIGRTNLIEAEYSSANKTVRMNGHEFGVDNLPDETDSSVILSVRPEDFKMSRDNKGGIESRLLDSIFLGLNTHFLVELPDKKVVEIIRESVMDAIFKPGDAVYLSLETEKINVFSNDGNRNLIRAD
ncbi:MAG: ABC transporter ATP-binding protein [Spirochaetales bacterium]|jgi:iron(III) transport system ATP-binding protein|nr:ABC transporter ATP-binding protein [Spirochaetales bacterium]